MFANFGCKIKCFILVGIWKCINDDYNNKAFFIRKTDECILGLKLFKDWW
jgi:hypothetical protein